MKSNASRIRSKYMKKELLDNGGPHEEGKPPNPSKATTSSLTSSSTINVRSSLAQRHKLRSRLERTAASNTKRTASANTSSVSTLKTTLGKKDPINNVSNRKDRTDLPENVLKSSNSRKNLDAYVSSSISTNPQNFNLEAASNVATSLRPPHPISLSEVEVSIEDLHSDTYRNIGKKSSKPSPLAVSTVTAILHSPSFSNEQNRSKIENSNSNTGASIFESSPPVLPPPRSLSFLNKQINGDNAKEVLNGSDNDIEEKLKTPDIETKNEQNDFDPISKTPAPPSSPLRDIKHLLSSVSNINRTFNTPLPPTTSTSSPSRDSQIKISAALQKRYPNLMKTPQQPFMSSSASITSSISASSIHSNQEIHNQKSNYTSIRKSDGSVSYVLPKTPSRESLLSRNSYSVPAELKSQFQHDENSTHDSSFLSDLNEKKRNSFMFDSCPGSIYTLDALCLRYNSNILVKSHCVNGNSEIVSLRVNRKYLSAFEQQKQDDIAQLVSQRFEASASGTGLGNEYEIFKIVKADVLNTTSSFAATTYHQHQTSPRKKDQDNIICYGDTVAFISGLAYDRALGVRKDNLQKNNEFPQTEYEMGFFRSLLGQAEKWTILWGGRREDPIELGRSANDTDIVEAKKFCRPVRSEEPLVLKNVLTGGLLALEQQEDIRSNSNAISALGLSLTVLTPTLRAAMSNLYPSHPASEMFRFIHPGRFEKWQIVQVNTPPCPHWNNTENERYFLNGRFTMYPDRNNLDHTIGHLFQYDNSGKVDPDKRSSPAHFLNEKNIDSQEEYLLDEVIGALMGLESIHVKVYTENIGNDRLGIRKSNRMGLASKKASSQSRSAEIMNKNECDINMISLSMHEINFGIKKCQSNMDTSLYHLIQQILPLATNFGRVNAFVMSRRARYEFGLVAHALVSAMNSLLQEYLVFVCQMELLLSEKKLTMQKLWCFIQPSLRTMQVFHDVVEKVHAAKGGALLNILEKMLVNSYEGDERAHNLLKFLIEQAAEPYMEMLCTWTSTGQLNDPYGEFFIQLRDADRTKRLNGNNWEDFFDIREQNILHMLSNFAGEDIPKRILTAGKYQKVCGQCGNSAARFPQAQHTKYSKKMSFDMGSIQIARQVQLSFNQSAEALQKMLMKESRLLDCLFSMKKYFLLSQGDFFVQFLDLSENELFQEISNVSKGRVQSLLSMAMQLGASETEVFRDSLQCDFASCSIVNDLDTIHAGSGGIILNEPRTPKRRAYGSQTELTGVEAFMLLYKAPWPLSIVLSDKAISSYQLIFRHLFFSKHVERRLFETWLNHQMIKELNLRSILGPTYLLRQRMLHFMQNFVYYVMFEVIEPRWHNMKMKIKNAKTVDEVLHFHNSFLAATHKECLLKNRNLLMTLTKIMQTCLLFSDQMKRFAKSTKLVSVSLVTSFIGF